MKCLILTLIAGSSWAFSSWLFLPLLALALLVTGYGGWWLALRMRKIVQKKTVLHVKPVAVITEQMAELKKNSKYVGTLVVGLILGWSLHAVKQFQHTYVLNDVKVLGKQSTSNYLLQTDHHVDFVFKLCSDSQVDWVPGSTLKILVYEDRGSCHSISDRQLGYTVERGSDGEPILNGGI